MEEMRGNSNLLSKFAHSKKTEEEMKRNTIFAAAMALCMGLSFTSCLDSGNDSYNPEIRCFAKTGSYMGLNFFKSADGKTTIYPTTASMSNLEKDGFSMSKVNAAYIIGTYDASINNNLDSSVDAVQEYKDVNVAAVSLDAKVEIAEPGAENDSVIHQLIRAIDLSKRTSQTSPLLKPWFFYDKTTLVLPISYSFQEYKKHAFTLVYAPSSTKADDNTINLRLCHYNGNEKSTQYDSFDYSGYPYLFFFAFDLNEVYSEWRNITHSTYPETITITYWASDRELDPAGVEPEEYVVDCKAIRNTL